MNVVKFVLRIVSLIAVFVVAVAGGYMGYNRVVNQKPASAQTAVRLQPATMCSIAATVATTGPLNSTSQARLSFKSGGKLKELNARVGDSVKAGQVLAKLDTTDLEFTLAQNMVNLENAQLKLAQLKAGPTSNDVAIAKASLDKTALALQKAQSDYDKIAWRSDVGMSTQAQTLQSSTLDYQSALANYAKATAGSTTTDIQVQENSGQDLSDHCRSGPLQPAGRHHRCTFRWCHLQRDGECGRAGERHPNHYPGRSQRHAHRSQY